MARREHSSPTGPAILPDGYGRLLADLKERIRDARTRASVSVNRKLVLLYWEIGRCILNRQREEGWGARVIDRLSADVRATFPGIKGFSARNLKRMKAFYCAYGGANEIVPQPVAQLERLILPNPIACLPWGPFLFVRRTSHKWELGCTLPVTLFGGLEAVETMNCRTACLVSGGCHDDTTRWA